jgi:riboflavin kinase / FMN adenylyltransferase
MMLVRGFHNLGTAVRPCVATIGNFDGVHRGHQAVLAHLRARATGHGLPAAVVVFEPQPDEYFRPTPPARLSTLREKIEAFAALDIAQVVCLHFGPRLAATPAEEFIGRLLVEGLAIRHLVVGPDFRFGHARRGDVAMLDAAGTRAGFVVETLAPYVQDGERVSSTAVRAALAAGDLARAARLLGRPYAVSGRVAHGDARGRTLGFPTANLPVRRGPPAIRGVYAAWVEGAAAQPLPAVVNVGIRPTVGGERALLEAHLLGFSGSLYGTRLRMRFVRRLREERRFPSVDALRAQIERDADEARACLAESPP